MLNNKNDFFDEGTYKRLVNIDPVNIPYKSSLVNYLSNLPSVEFIKPNFSSQAEKAPLKSLIESRFARYDSILSSVKRLTHKYVLDLNPHIITIYGTVNLSKEYINHVASIIRWWEKINPQKYIITFYLTDIKKTLPPDHLPKVITEEFANSGFTFVKEPSDIHIFRKEESLKVLIHELIHACKFDFNGSYLVDIPCNIKDDDISNEGITEYLAIIHYYWYVASYITNNSNINIISSMFDELLSNDLSWQDHQVSKILNYFDLDADDLLGKNNFKQKTSILSYFFLKDYLFTQDSLPIILSRDISKINSLIKGMKGYLLKHEKIPVSEQSVSLRMCLYELA